MVFKKNDFVTTPAGPGIVMDFDAYSGYYCVTSPGTPQWFKTGVSLAPDAAIFARENAGLLVGHCSRARVYHGKSGSDPEIFVLNSKGVVIPAWMFLPQEQEAKAVPWFDRNSDHKLGAAKAYWDGAQAELSTSGQPSCHEYLTDEVRRGLLSIYEAALVVDDQATLAAVDVVKMPPVVLRTADHAFIQFGCTPSANAYGIEPVEMGDPRDVPIRFAGCHLHGSVPKNLLKGNAPPPWFPNGVVKSMDRTVGILLTALGRDLENPERRKYYGRPGEFRMPQREGQVSIEYRTPSAYLMRHPALFVFGADMARAAYHFGLNFDVETVGLPDVKDIIMASDADAAVKYIKAHKDVFVAMIDGVYGNKFSDRALPLILKGAAKMTSGDVIDNWKLKGQWAAAIDGHQKNFRTLVMTYA